MLSKESRSEFIQVRGIKYHVRHWGHETSRKIFMLHGYMDVSASFQFLVDHLRHEWHVIAPDWRGFGLTENTNADSYWGQDMIGDLDHILLYYGKDEPIDLLGHSRGASVAMTYAGVRPTRVRRLINIEGFGMPEMHSQQYPDEVGRWLDKLLDPPVARTYASKSDVAASLRRANPLLPEDRATFLAQHRSTQMSDGRWTLAADPAHMIPSPLLYRTSDIMECWKRITAPVLSIEGEDTDIWRWFGEKDAARLEIQRRLNNIADLRSARIKGAGHMVHHDQPATLARIIEEFL